MPIDIAPPDSSDSPDSPGYNEIRLPDGTILSLQDWIAGDLYSALIIDPWTPTPMTWELFTYSRASVIPDTMITAKRSHTNLPRNGSNGLPRDWEMYVTRWRAHTNMVLDQVILDWASELVVSFAYNDKVYSSTPLIDILLGTRSIGDPLPIHMRENLGYMVQVENNQAATAKLQEWLRKDDSEVHSKVNTELDAIVRLHADNQNLVSALRYAQSKLQKGRTLTLWTHLEGPLKRCVV